MHPDHKPRDCFSRRPILTHTMPQNHFQRENTNAQRDGVICTKSHIWARTELGWKPRQSGFTVPTLSHEWKRRQTRYSCMSVLGESHKHTAEWTDQGTAMQTLPFHLYEAPSQPKWVLLFRSEHIEGKDVKEDKQWLLKMSTRWVGWEGALVTLVMCGVYTSVHVYNHVFTPYVNGSSQYPPPPIKNPTAGEL